MPWKVSSLSLLALFALAVSLDVQVCLNCWDTLCEGSSQNLESICPCNCINTTVTDKCAQSILNEPCCPLADSFVSSNVLPDIEPVAPIVNYSTVCSTAYNLPPSNFAISNIQDYDEIDFNHQYVLYTPFDCSGCITNITLSHRFMNTENRNLSIQIWRTHRNTSDNSTLLVLDKDVNVLFPNQSMVWLSTAYQTVGTPTEEVCYEAGDIFGVTVPSIFNQLDIIKQLNTPDSQFYSRQSQTCQSLNSIFYLGTTINSKPFVAVSVSNSIVVPSSSTAGAIVSSTVDSILLSTSFPVTSSLSIESSSIGSTSTTFTVSSSRTIILATSKTTDLDTSSSFTVLFTTSPASSLSPTTGLQAEVIIYAAAGVVVFIVLFLIIIVVVLLLFIFLRIHRKYKTNETKPTEPLPLDLLDFQRVVATNPNGYLNGFPNRISNGNSINPTPDSSRRTESILTHDYDDPNVLNLVDFRRSRDTLVSREGTREGGGPDYMTMTSNNIRTNTPSSVSSEHSQYSHPRLVPRYQSPSTSQRYDSPRSIAASNISEYDDPTNVLNRTPRVDHRLLPKSRFGNNDYHVLENPNEETGQPERPYFELEPSNNTLTKNHHYHVLEENTGYHVPTKQQRESMLILGNDNMLTAVPYQNQFFAKETFYWEPSQVTESIYDQLNQYKCREIPQNDIQFMEQIGEGQFGTVWSGMWSLAGGGKRAVAIKVLKPSANEEDKAKFLREGARMMQFFHANVVKLYGVCTLKDPPFLIQELMKEGDLKTYLKNCRQTTSSSNVKPTRPIPSAKQLLKFCRDIASGMKHLGNKKFVHRDLAARNVLLNDNLICKIADFGMTRAADHFFDPNKAEQIPLRWTAPEAINSKHYSEKSDVYSYGMVLYEIWSLGRKPFPQLHQNQEIIDFITQKRLIPPPPGCPRTIYHLMVKCWNPLPGGRLSFDSICNDYFSANDDSLLTWETEDYETSPRAAEIGAPLSEGYGLYRELQHEYR